MKEYAALLIQFSGSFLKNLPHWMEVFMSDDEYMRQQARESYERDQQTQMANEQAIQDYQERVTYNAELARQRQIDEDRRRQQGGY